MSRKDLEFIYYSKILRNFEEILDNHEEIPHTGLNSVGSKGI